MASPYLLELVQRPIDPETMAHSTGKNAALGANAAPMALNHGERPNRMMNPRSG
jgi:hypothetical protein